MGGGVTRVVVAAHTASHMSNLPSSLVLVHTVYSPHASSVSSLTIVLSKPGSK